MTKNPIIGGTLELGPHAKLDGDLNLGGGTVNRSPQAQVTGIVNAGSGSGSQVPFFTARTGISEWSGISVADRWLDYLLDCLLVSLVAALVVRFLGRHVRRTGQATGKYPVVAAALGVLLVIMLPSLLVLMAFTIVLFPVVALGVLLLGLAIGYGWISMGFELGAHLARWRNWKLPAAGQAFVGTLVFTLVVNGMGFLPIVGSIIPIVAASVGIGAAFLTRFGTRVYVPATPEPLGAGMSPAARQEPGRMRHPSSH